MSQLNNCLCESSTIFLCQWHSSCETFSPIGDAYVHITVYRYITELNHFRFIWQLFSADILDACNDSKRTGFLKKINGNIDVSIMSWCISSFRNMTFSIHSTSHVSKLEIKKHFCSCSHDLCY